MYFSSRPISCEDSNMANVEFGTGKTVLILTIVAACFAVLWPKIFYPMLISSPGGKTPTDDVNGCCDVIFETDVNAIKIMSEMCGSIFKRYQDLDPKLTNAFLEGKYSKKLVEVCRSEVMNICGIDIAEILNEKVRLGHSYRQILDEIRSYNISVCLRQNFGISPGSLGSPRRMRLWGPSASRHLRQERPLHLRPEMMHPALRERGRAIPQSSLPTKKPTEKEGSARPPPIPGMRPPMGGAGHVVPPPKVGATMSIVMPLYTIGIVIFSMYTIMKVFIRKTGSSDNYKDFTSDPEFRRVVFADEYSNGCPASVSEEGLASRSKRNPSPPLFKTPSTDTTRLVMTAITGLLAEVDQQLSREGDTQTQYSTDLKDDKRIVEEICAEAAFGKKDLSKSEQVDKRGKTDLQVSVIDKKVEDDPAEDDDTRPKVKVMGVETVAECEGGQKWSRPATPTLGVGTASVRRLPPEDVEPSNIFLEGALPTQSQLLVTDSKTHTLQEDGPETPVILSGTVTLSLISLHTGLPMDRTSQTHSPAIEESGSHTREEETAEGEKSEKVEEELTNYTTATMSEDAEVAEIEDTRADVSNMETLDTAEDQDDLEDDSHDWNVTEGENRVSQISSNERNEE